MENALFAVRSNVIANSAGRPFSGPIWNRLQQLKEEVAQELLDEGPLCQSEPDDVRDDSAPATDSREIEWHHRSQLEERLRDITDAQDRIIDGNYGSCIECGEQISAARLAADPVISLCLSCQSNRETETVFPTL